MTITYKWKINRLITEPINDQQNVVTTVSYELEGSDDENSGETGGHFSVKYNPNVFTPFEQLTEEQVVEWVKNKLGAWGIKREQDIITARLEIMKTKLPPLDMNQHNTPWR